MAITLNDDYSKKWTEKQLSELEKTLAEEYSTAWKELKKKTDEYFKKFEKREKEYWEGLQNGTIKPYGNMTIEEHYAAWRTAQIGRGKRWETMKNQMADRMVSTNKVAASYINDTTPGIASLNHNYSCYQIEKAVNISDDYSAGVSFTLVNEDTIRNLMEGNNQSEFKVSDGNGSYTFRRNLVNSTSDYNWNSKRIQTALTQGILQGESIPQITKRFEEVMGSNHKAAVRNARTSVTSAQNAGTMQAYKEAKAMGIELQVEWMATRDNRTRDSHAELDGVRIEEGKEFPNGLKYPGDPGGRPEEVYNCRCTTKGIIPKINDKQKYSNIPNHEGYHTEETYNQWVTRKFQESKVQGANTEEDKDTAIKEKLIRKKIVNNPVQKYNGIRTEKQIISELSGADRTGGSCASLAFAYCGNKEGYYVLDFRGGQSKELFSKYTTMKEINNIDGVVSKYEKGYNDVDNAIKLLQSMDIGKEYILATGEHTAIVKHIGSGYYYLELQSSKRNGWHKFNEGTLENRFYCKDSVRFLGIKLKQSSCITEVDSLKNKEEFIDLLGYINTDASYQEKGDGGYAK